MPIGSRIKELRQRRGWSQAQLARMIDIHQKQVSTYEREIHSPSLDALCKLARVFNVSLDYLAFDDHEEPQRTPISDRELLDRLEAIDKLPEKDKDLIKGVLDTFIFKGRFQELAAGG